MSTRDKTVLKNGDCACVTGVFSPLKDPLEPVFADSIKLLDIKRPEFPKDVLIANLEASTLNYAYVRTEGFLSNVIPDDISPEYVFLQITDGQNSIIAAIQENAFNAQDAASLLHARIRFCGSYFAHRLCHRPFISPIVIIGNRQDIEILQPPPSPFDHPECVLSTRLSPSEIIRQGRRTASGTVLAVWQNDRAIIALRNGQHQINALLHMSSGELLPKSGQSVKVVGDVTTDMFHLVFKNARTAPLADAPAPDNTKPVTTSLRDLFQRRGNRHSVTPELCGRLIRVKGVVCDHPQSQPEMIRLRDEDGFSLDVEASACTTVLKEISVGCTIEATGVFVFEAETWHVDTPFPRIEKSMLVLRSSDDLVIVGRPFPLTPRAFVWIIGGFLLTFLFLFAWNRALHHLVERRSRQLLRKQTARNDSELRIGERTRLAVELHDTLSQNLVGVACQIAVVQDVIRSDAETASARLATAERTLDSCRTGLRQVLTDLRSDALDAKDFSSAIATVLEPVKGDARVAIRFNVPRHRFRDSTAHAILCIIRELVGNAVRHGHATDIKIAGALDSDKLLFSVRENGRGFDPTMCPGTLQGHFGLEGVRNRVKRLKGAFRINSSPGDGSYACISIPLPRQTKPHS